MSKKTKPSPLHVINWTIQKWYYSHFYKPRPIFFNLDSELLHLALEKVMNTSGEGVETEFCSRYPLRHKMKIETMDDFSKIIKQWFVDEKKEAIKRKIKKQK